MFTIISRIFHFGIKNFTRNGWLSVATVAIMTLALIVFAGLILFGYVTQPSRSIDREARSTSASISIPILQRIRF
jgi:cell division protein FtsX